jgi:hypothetical protein
MDGIKNLGHGWDKSQGIVVKKGMLQCKMSLVIHDSIQTVQGSLQSLPVVAV